MTPPLSSPSTSPETGLYREHTVIEATRVAADTSAGVVSRLRATYQRRGTGWEGVLRDEGGHVVEACGHYHRNRDANTSLRIGAVPCAVRLAILRGLRREAAWGTSWWVEQ